MQSSKTSNILWRSEIDWVGLWSGLLIFLVQFDGLVSFASDQTGP